MKVKIVSLSKYYIVLFFIVLKCPNSDYLLKVRRSAGHLTETFSLSYFHSIAAGVFSLSSLMALKLMALCKEISLDKG